MERIYRPQKMNGQRPAETVTQSMETVRKEPAYDARDRRNRDSREKRDMTDRRGNNNRGRHER